MKKLVLLPFLAFALIFTGCNKPEDETTPQSAYGEGEVVFTGQTVDIGQLKGTMDDEYAEYAEIKINDGNASTTYTREVYYTNNKAYTQAIKLPAPGTYTVEEILLYDDNQTPLNSNDDVLLFATPAAGSENAQYVNTATPFDFTIEAFKKTEVPVEVLRFVEADYLDFGFAWFALEESVIYEHCFFGDICIKNPDDYIGSLYTNQDNGLMMDMPTIAKIEVWQESTKDDDTDYELTGTFSNEYYPDGSDWFGEGDPLCVTYKDYNLYVDAYKLELFIYVADGETFSYKHFLTWEFTDQNAETVLSPGDDGVTDYVLGTCVPDADFMIPPYMNLPATATFSYNSSPGDITDGYFDAQISNVGNGYEIADSLYPGWCFDDEHFIYPGIDYEMDVYSSLYPNLMPDFIEIKPWDKANWLMNHLDWYDGYEWEDIQGALWTILGRLPSEYPHGGISGQTTLAAEMADDADSYGGGYMPLPGGWAAVIFVNDQSVQTVFIVVDP